MRKTVSEGVAGWAPGSHSGSTFPMFDILQQGRSRWTGETHQTWRTHLCVTLTPQLSSNVTFHTVSAHKIQWWLKPQGRMTRSAFDTDSISGPACLLQQPYTQAMQGEWQEVTAELHKELQTTSSVISLWEKKCELPHSTLLTPAMTESKECHQ